MSRARKFSTFAGVFTPSILTILGVIMYLRLPSIVGQAGLLQTLGIIAVAHIISVATGLSVSSIATDKKVKAGGTYYMISRSLGLPIGGTLGLALFVGLSFSVSLYLIGFSESFLSYWNLPVNLTTIRITGIASLVGVTVVTLVSTALALRMQFYIMAAIALSLLSILLGRHEFAPAAPLLRPAATAAPFIVLFGIFFPAVTGFEAGVSMSGDLRDPKKSIPVGTISAILVGLLAYLGLTAFLAFTVDPVQLRDNPRVLLDIALFPPLVVAGIWGATISSAFGSILGAPRILQAAAADGIAPRWFARGYGRENEPRNALLLAFLIAGAGILIGSLDVIARIVSMFFITTYGFLNLAAAIESWVSPDFRPEFRIPKVVGFTGALACLIVMIQLDFLAMAGASILLGALYFWLARKQLRLETGDAWAGVWSTLARAALHRLDRGGVHRRNWWLNVMVFSGERQARPHLVELGRHLAGKRGMLTAFDLAEDGPPDARSGVEPGGESEMPYGVFARRIPCDDVYQAIEETATHYGFAGIEPNTVLMGWGRNTRDASRFVATIQQLAGLDLNLLLLDYDAERGWGQRERIDVWWQLTGSDVALSLALIRFLTTSDDWRDARVRFITVNHADSALAARVLSEMTRVLDEHRVEADVRVINNAVEQRAFLDLVRAESVDADLTIIGISDLRDGDPVRFVADTTRMVDELRSVVLVHASSYFAEPLVRVPAALPARHLAGPIDVPEPEPEESTAAELFEPIARLCERLDPLLAGIAAGVHDEFVGRAFAISEEILEDTGATIAGALSELGNALKRDQGEAAVERVETDLLTAFAMRLDRMKAESVPAQAALLAGAVDALPARTGALAADVPARLPVEVPMPALEPAPEDDWRVGLARRAIRTRAGFRAGSATFTARPRPIVEGGLRMFAADALAEAKSVLAADAAATIADVERLLDSGLDTIDQVAIHVTDGQASEIAFVGAEAVRSMVLDMTLARVHAATRLRTSWLNRSRHMVRSIGDEATRFDVGFAVREARRVADSRRMAIRGLAASVATFERAQMLLIEGAALHTRLGVVRHALGRIGTDLRAGVRAAGDDTLVRGLHGLRDMLARLEAGAPGDLDFGAAAEVHPMLQPETVIETLRAALGAALRGLPDTVDVVSAESAALVTEGRVEDVEATSVPVNRIVEYIMETDLIAPLAEALPPAASAAEEAAETCREVARLVAYHFQSGGESAGPPGDEAGSAVRTGIERIDNESARFGSALDVLDAEMDAAFERTAGRLEPHPVRRASEKLLQYERRQRGRAVRSGVLRMGRSVSDELSRRAVRLVYQRSEGVLLTRRLRLGSVAEKGSLRSIRQLVDAVSPDTRVLEQLPGYYRRLFLGRPALTSDVRIGFESELADAAAALDLFHRGRTGSLIILAEQGQGRTTLAGLVARRHFAVDRIFRLDAPDGGSIDPAVFVRRLAAATRTSGRDPARLIAGLPANSAIVINDLGLWWERSPGGFAVIDLIADLIGRFGAQRFFMVTANARAFRLINRIRPIEDQFGRIIECEPFTARELRDVILLRHSSTGMRFVLDHRWAEDEMGDWRMARLFAALFDASGGNIGVALNTWIAGVRGVEGDVIRIASPALPSLDPLEALGPLHVMLLVQYVLHDRLDLDRLARICGLEKATLAREIRALERAGLLVSESHGISRIDRYFRPHLCRFLARRGLIG